MTSTEGLHPITTVDGRRLDVRVSGPEDGMPLVFHHGTPGAATPFRVVERAAHERNLRLVTFSRPGYGGSSRHLGRSVADVVSDTTAVLDHVGSDACLVAGWSGGGPNALACAARLGPARAVLVIAGVAPFDGGGLDWMSGMGGQNLAEFKAALGGESELRGLLDAVREHLKEATPELLVSSLKSVLPDVDKAVLTDEFGEDMAAGFREALRNGVDGWLDDDLALLGPWGFDMDEIACPTMIWHGTEDLMVPFTHGEWLAPRVPGARARLQQGEGHLSIAIGAIGRMLDELIAAG